MTKAEERLRLFINSYIENNRNYIKDGRLNKDIETVLNIIENSRIFKNNCKHRFNSGRWRELDNYTLFNGLDKILGDDENDN